MRTLKIGFSKSKSDAIFSVLLQKYMNRNYSHVFVLYNTEKLMGDDSIYHSSLSSGIGFMSKSIFQEDNEIVQMYEIQISDEVYFEIRKQLFSVCGRKYGFLQNIGIAIVDLLGNIGIRIKNPFVKDQNCSELLFRHVISVAYPEYKNDYDPNTVTPADIEFILEDIEITKNNQNN